MKVYLKRFSMPDAKTEQRWLFDTDVSKKSPIKQYLGKDYIMKHNYHICPIRAIENEIDISCSYVFLTRRDDIDVQPNVLLLDVLDTEEERHPYRFTNEHARKILEFIDDSGIEDVFVCCDQGESRSAGVAAALIELEGGDSSYIWKSSEYHPNRLFYKTMKEVLKTYKEIKI